MIALIFSLICSIARADSFIQKSYGVGVPTVESVKPASVPTAGAYKLGYNGVATPSIASGSNAATVQAALRSIPAIPNTTVTGSETAGFAVTLPDIPGPAQTLTVAANTLSGLVGAILLNIGVSTPGVAAYTVGTTDWVELVPSTDFGFFRFMVYDTSGHTMLLGLGDAGSEAAIAIIPPNSLAPMTVQIAAGKRLSLKSITGQASSGQIIANFWRQ